ncbi:hypothetical protein NL676_020606 [Syzygium grande]|nr:hypothetical protein NL676_020606 [Syzygium grande]
MATCLQSLPHSWTHHSPLPSCCPRRICTRRPVKLSLLEGTKSVMVILYPSSQEASACFVPGSGDLRSKSWILVRVDLAFTLTLSTMIRPRVGVSAVELRGQI